MDTIPTGASGDLTKKVNCRFATELKKSFHFTVDSTKFILINTTCTKQKP